VSRWTDRHSPWMAAVDVEIELSQAPVPDRRHKVSRADVRDIRARKVRGESAASIAKVYRLSARYVRVILSTGLTVARRYPEARAE
jgi:hypothetical protein